ncbi:MAG: AMP nucleosidase [Burkholderiaceae bacterium]
MTPTPLFPTQRFSDPDAAVAYAATIYDGSVTYLREQLTAFVQGDVQAEKVRACYPFVRIRTNTVVRADSRLSFGFVAGPGRFETSLTRIELFADYLRQQFALLLRNHTGELEIGVSEDPIPIHFAIHSAILQSDAIDVAMPVERRTMMRDLFDLPDLAAMDDGIANGTQDLRAGDAHPLSLFTAPRVDYSLQRLRHYTGTEAEHFQKFVLFTNYQFYIDEFVRIGLETMAGDPSVDPETVDTDAFDRRGYVAFVEPGNVITHRVGSDHGDPHRNEPPPRLPQMPAYHLKRADGTGITMVNIGVGPANAKNISDHIAVLRPHAWLMLGHCAGLRTTQRLGDYILAHGYVREDHVLDEELPLWIPIPALAEVQQALEQAVADITRLSGYELKRILRTGTVASTDNRNWELLPHPGPERRFSQSRAIALDMESATIAANGFRFRVPYGTLLCVSDKPLHGEIKLPGMANQFYRERVDQHLRVGMRTVELLRALRLDQLHSRKLRSFAEVAFR